MTYNGEGDDGSGNGGTIYRDSVVSGETNHWNATYLSPPDMSSYGFTGWTSFFYGASNLSVSYGGKSHGHAEFESYDNGGNHVGRTTLDHADAWTNPPGSPTPLADTREIQTSTTISQLKYTTGTTSRSTSVYGYRTTTSATSKGTSNASTTGSVSTTIETTTRVSHSTTTKVGTARTKRYTAAAVTYDGTKTVYSYPLARYVTDTIYQANEGNKLMVALWTDAFKPISDMVYADRTTISCLDIISAGVAITENSYDNWETWQDGASHVDVGTVEATITVNNMGAFPNVDSTITVESTTTSAVTQEGAMVACASFTPFFTYLTTVISLETITETGIMGIGHETYTYEYVLGVPTTSKASSYCGIIYSTGDGWAQEVSGCFAVAGPAGNTIAPFMQTAGLVAGQGAMIHSTNFRSSPKGGMITGEGFTIWGYGETAQLMNHGLTAPIPYSSYSTVLSVTTSTYSEFDSDYDTATQTITYLQSISTSRWSSLTMGFTTGSKIEYTLMTADSTTAGVTKATMMLGTKNAFSYGTVYGGGDYVVGGLRQGWEQGVSEKLIHGFIVGNNSDGSFTRGEGNTVHSVTEGEVSVMSIYPLVIGPYVSEYRTSSI